jgi:diguanylate cyclase (GGDEF)-like protein
MSSSSLVGIVLVPGFITLLLLLVFSYLHYQTQRPYFRAWQCSWAFYCAHYVFEALVLTAYGTLNLALLARIAMIGTILCIQVSTHLIRDDSRWHWEYIATALLGGALAVWNTVEQSALKLPNLPHIALDALLGVVLLVCAYRFHIAGRRLHAFGHRMLGFALAVWGLLLVSHQFSGTTPEQMSAAGNFLGPLPQMLAGIAMVVVLFEDDRRLVQENALALSSIGIAHNQMLAPAEVAPRLESILDRVMALAHAERGAIAISSSWRSTLPVVARNMPASLTEALQKEGVAEALSDSATDAWGVTAVPLSPDASTPNAAVQNRWPRETFTTLRRTITAEEIDKLIVFSLRTPERNLGAIVLALHNGRRLAPMLARMLAGLSTQLAVTLENFVLMQDAQRRTMEYRLLTEIGKAISSHLDPDQVLKTIHTGLGQLFETDTFYVAFADDGTVRYEFEVVEGVLQPKHWLPAGTTVTDHVLRTGKPLLIRSRMDEIRKELGLTTLRRGARCYCGVPIFMGGKAAGVMAALSYKREFAYDTRDLEILETAAGQVAVAMENARVFASEQKRVTYLDFLNKISRLAISSQDAEAMLAEIMLEIDAAFRFDHVGIGILDYTTKEIEIKAEAGNNGTAGRRIPLGSGIIGRSARGNECILLRDIRTYQMTLLPDARSAMCLPLTYGDSMLGVLNIENRMPDSFPEQEAAILRTLADLLATALHNALVFQTLEQQSMTDSLTGVKTRRFFLDAMQSEWKRASRSGRPFSVVLMDLDRFKHVNDTLGHLEGDLVLARVGRLLEQKCRQSNVVARYGGDEFVVLMPETGLEQARVLAERLRLWIASDALLQEHNITGSFGLGSYPLHGSSAQDILRVADAGMYVSKHAGGNRVCTAEEIVEPESALLQREVLQAYVEGVMRRDDSGPESLEELVSTLKKMAASMDNNPAPLMDSILALSRAAETREMHAAGHGEFVARYAQLLAREAGLSDDDARELGFAARVHDVGKIVVPERILCKPGLLSLEEEALLKAHAVAGARIVSAIPGNNRLVKVIRHHHERVDGTGYPDELVGEAIPIGARILRIADAFVQMTSERPFAAARQPSEAVDILRAGADRQFDARLVEVFASCVERELRRTGAGRVS